MKITFLDFFKLLNKMSDRVRLVDEDFEDEPLNSDPDLSLRHHNNDVINNITTKTKIMGEYFFSF